MIGLPDKGYCSGEDHASEKNRCIGKPKCPDGHKAKGEDCIVTVASAKPHGGAVAPPDTQGPRPPPPPPNGAVPKFSLDAKTYAAGGTIQIKFASPIASPINNRSWITVVEADKAKDQYGAWTYIEDQATAAQLPVPRAAGAYEVRLDADANLVWIERTPSGETRHATEPGTGFLQRAFIGFLSLLPIDWML